MVRADLAGTSDPALPRGRLLAVDAAEVRVCPSARALPEDPLEPWQLPAARWSELEPAGAYARLVRTPFLWACALVLGVLALPLGVLIGALNWIQHGDPRRILFSQPRVGRRGRVFRVLKFRTMRGRRRASEGSERDLERVTRFGRLLRNTHLDELPQLVNVLRGDMALIGPRPEMVSIERWAARAVPGFSERLVVRPGLTGRAQVTQGYTGRDAEAYREKLRLNRAYLERLTLGADLGILVRTVLWMLSASGWRT